MGFQIIWQILSYGVVFTVGSVLLLEVGSLWWSLAILVGVPLWRLYRRFQPGKGYYLIGRTRSVGEPGGKSGLVTRDDDPIRFKLLLLAEIGVLIFWVVGVFVLPGPG